jgi:glycerophosphoryl diester phosphodiesterase
MRKKCDTDFFNLPLPRVMAHRGSSGSFPENTMLAFQEAVKAGVSYIELDVHMTRDGEVVVCHDDDLKRTTNSSGLIRELSCAEVTEADAGYSFVSTDGTFPFRGQGLSVPRLAEVLTAFPHVNFVIEIKQVEPSLVAALSQTIEKARMRRHVLIASEHQRPLNEARQALPGVPTNFSSVETAEFFSRLALSHLTRGTEEVYDPPGEALQIPPQYHGFTLVTEQSVARARDLGIEMHVWTVNDTAQVQSFLGLGVHGIITDYPEAIMALV